ncbi:uncharacterized protein LOC142906671 [Petromyzon marinus]|uniref:uncharacterized protein LOC142906671 n=1 Tax=Petromyzon marinus TaxID=7757 RepID=UPI003F70E61B
MTMKKNALMCNQLFLPRLTECRFLPPIPGYERENVALRTKVKAQRRLLQAEEARKPDLGGLFTQLRKTKAQLTALVSGIGNFNVRADDADGIATESISAAAVGATATTNGNTAIPASATAAAIAEGSTAKAGDMTVATSATSHHSSTAAAVDETATAAATNPKLVIRRPRLAAAGEIVTGIDTPTTAMPRFVIKRPRSAAATGKSSTGIATPAAPGRTASADATATAATTAATTTTITTTTSARGKATRANRFRKFYRNFHWWATARKSTMATPDDAGGSTATIDVATTPATATAGLKSTPAACKGGQGDQRNLCIAIDIPNSA